MTKPSKKEDKFICSVCGAENSNAFDTCPICGDEEMKKLGPKA